MKIIALLTGCLVSSAALADDGLYYGLSLGIAHSSSESFGDISAGNDVTLGGTVGYRFALSNGATAAIEGTYDATTGNLMSFDDGPDACADWAPTWCQIDGIVRLRGVYQTTLPNGFDVISMGGFASAFGVVEDGPGNYVDAAAVGYTLGVGTQLPTANGTVRLELNYDRLDDVADAQNYERTLEIVSFRTTYEF